MIRSTVYTLCFYMFLLQTKAQVKVGLWEPSYNSKTKKAVFFTGDSLTTSFIKNDDEHGMAVGFILNKNIKENIGIYHAGFIPITQNLQQTGVLELTIEKRKKHLEFEYEYYRQFAIQTVAWFKAQDVRVVNMSFGTSATIFAENNQNLGITDTARMLAARLWMTYFKNSFTAAFISAPNILFVVAAGNDEEDMGQSMDVPGLIDLPNVLCIGALAKDGKKIISNYGKRVDMYLPAENMQWIDNKGMPHLDTGTSLAVPQVTARAVQLILKNPTITAAQIKILLMRQNDNNNLKIPK